MAHDLSRLLRPRSIVVIGGGSWCENTLRTLHRFGFAGEIWAVHPRRTEVAGVRAYRSIADLPGVPDAAFIGVNRGATLACVAALAAVSAGGAICFASGFGEAVAELADGADLQAQLVAAAGEMPILGPNCYGVLNALDGVALWPDQHGLVPVAGGVAIVGQSSNIALNLTMQARGLPVAYVVTAGNQAQTSMAQIGRALLEDPRVTALGLHIEGIGDVRAFEALAHAARVARKPIVALKVGASAQAQVATVSHTASLAGRDAGGRALFERLGIAQVDSLGAFLETLKLLHVCGPLPSCRIASMSCSGGEASLVADTGLRAGVTFPPLDAGQATALRAALGPKVALANPLDYHTYIWGDVEAMTATFAAMMRGDGLALGCVILDFPRADRCETAEWDKVVTAVAQAQAVSGKPIAIVASLGETLPEAVAMAALARGVVALAGLPETMAAVAAASAVGRGPVQPPVLRAEAAVGDVRLVPEAEAKARLARFGVAVPGALVVSRDADPAALLEALRAPLAVKAIGLAHKTEARAVRLGLRDAPALASAMSAMPGCEVLVEDMVEGAVAELLVGVVIDPPHGVLLTLGAGGTWAELWDDTVHGLVPMSAADIDAALRRLRIAPLLDGYRGAPGANRQAIVAAVLAVQDYVMAEVETVVEVEVNPLICTPERAVAVDALIRERTSDG